MHSKTVQFLFDFGSPNAYLCHKVLPQLEARLALASSTSPSSRAGCSRWPTTVRRWKERPLANTQQAYERGAFGLPTFFVGDAMFFGKDRLSQVEEEIVRERCNLRQDKA